MKKIVIINHGGGELANQLWNYASVYAYSLEQKTKLVNPSFYEYALWFPKCNTGKFFWLFFALPFSNHTKRKNALKRKLWRKFYSAYSKCVIGIKKNSILSCESPVPFYLPPTASPDKLLKLESLSTVYLNGWLFRNPGGLIKYRDKIVEFFTPNDSVMQKINNEIADARKQYRHIVGVHIRQGDYRVWQNGKYFIEEKRTRTILDEYVKVNEISASETVFIIASDGEINVSIFSGLNIKQARGNAFEDLFLLSKTNAIIGSDSTYGDFAAYYGNIPHIVMTNSPIDWDYYKNMKNYVMGKYMTWVHF